MTARSITGARPGRDPLLVTLAASKLPIVAAGAQVAPGSYFSIPAPAGWRTIGLNPASDSGLIAQVSVEGVANPVILTPGSKFTFRPFSGRIFLAQLSGGPSTGTFLFDLAEDPSDVDYGPPSPASTQAGANNAAPFSVATSLASFAIVAARPGRRMLFLTNGDPANSLFLDPTLAVVASSWEIPPGGIVSLPTTTAWFGIMSPGPLTAGKRISGVELY